MKVLTAAQMREVDRLTMERGIPGLILMENAAMGVVELMAKRLGPLSAQRIVVICGKGNNGGDAIVAARHLAGAGCQPVLVLLCRRNELQGDPLLHFQKLVSAIRVYELPTLDELSGIVVETEPAVVVDGLLGTGLKGQVREPYATTIKIINGLHLPVVSIDIPSGLGSDTGEVHGFGVRADMTVTMGLPKIGLLKPAAADFVGAIEIADIGIPREFVEEISTDVELLMAQDVKPLLPPRRRSAHKGDFGHLLVIAGSEGYTGAPVMVAHAAARAGAGLVTLAVPRNIYPIVAAHCPPEVMTQPVDFEQFNPGYFARFDAVAIGPGLGQQAETQKMVWKVVSSCPVPMVVDADALNAMAQGVAALKKLQKPLVLTPHPGEMARLNGMTAKDVQTDRWGVARSFAQEYGVVVVLKGAGTVVTDKSSRLWINSTGNPGMAKGGMGDALTGIIGAFLTQGMAALDAARAGVFIHGLAGDLANKKLGAHAMLTTDLIEHLGAAFATLD